MLWGWSLGRQNTEQIELIPLLSDLRANRLQHEYFDSHCSSAAGMKSEVVVLYPTPKPIFHLGKLLLVPFCLNLPVLKQVFFVGLCSAPDITHVEKGLLLS